MKTKNSTSSSPVLNSQKLPPPPSKITSKVRLKQKYCDQPTNKKNLNTANITTTTLPPLNENSLLDEIAMS